MTASGRDLYDLSWNTGNLIALIVLCTASACAVGLRALRVRENLRSGIPVNEERSESAAERIDPNTATPASLRRLPGIGPTIAQRIVEYRTAHGPRPFRTPEDLTAVERIGEITVRNIRPYLALRDDPPGTAPPPSAARSLQEDDSQP